MNITGFIKAHEAAKIAEHNKYFIGAAIMKGKKTISTGANNNKTHPLLKGRTYRECLHAEMAAILNARSSVRGADIYVYRLRKCGSPGLAKPCEVCEEFLRKVGIRRVFYTDPNSESQFVEMRLDYG